MRWVYLFEHVVQPKRLEVEGKMFSHGNYTAAKSGLIYEDLGCASDIRLTLTWSIWGTPLAVIDRNSMPWGREYMFRKRSVVIF